MRQLSRRTLLRGAGTAIALPFLDAMLPAFAKTTPESPVRMMYVYAPTGIMPQAWLPPTTGPDFEFQRVMKPMEKFRKDVLVMSGLSQHDVGIGGPDGPGDHARAVGTYLTGARIRKTQGADIQAGVSVDQLAARAFGVKTRIPSLEVTCEDNYAVGACDSYSCAYQTLSFKSATEPLPPEANPRLLFERMFGQMDISADPIQRKNQLPSTAQHPRPHHAGHAEPQARPRRDRQPQAGRVSHLGPRDGDALERSPRTTPTRFPRGRKADWASRSTTRNTPA
jgi:hypothetical protein